MNLNPTALEALPASIRQAVRDYAGLLNELAGDKARALVIFGSAAGPEFDALHHAVHNVLVLEPIDLDLIRDIGQHGLRLGKSGVHAPLVMSPGFIEASLDTFPLELLEIQQHHVTLAGEDFFSGIRLAPTDVRLQCERELKVLLMGLRQGLLAAAGRPEAARMLGDQAAAALLRALRGLLWLRGQREGRPASKVLPDMEALCGRRLEGARAALHAQAGWSWEAFRALYGDVAFLEGWMHEQPAG